MIKVVWGREWDPLLAADSEGLLVERMNSTLDGDYQKIQVESGAYIREHFFGPDPRLGRLVAGLSDEELRKMRRGGHDPIKVYAAYRAALEHRGAPTVILAKTVKGWALGADIEARNATHQIKKMTWDEPTIPFFAYYSMFGFHRFGDLLWAAGDVGARGFLLAATAGRTTLQREGLQHCDGHSLLFASAIPNVRAYDPAFGYEMAVIVRDGLQRIHGLEPEDLLYYLALYNEPYVQPPMPEGVEDGIVAGLYRYRGALGERTNPARILASGPAVLAALEAQQELFDRFDVAAEVWSATSYKGAELAPEGGVCDRPASRRRRAHPPRRPR